MTNDEILAVIDSTLKKVDSFMLQKTFSRLTEARIAVYELIAERDALRTGNDIKQAVNRFLGWKLPTGFCPDDGISFDPIRNKGTKYEHRREPIGTNLFTAEQAEAMFQYCLAMPAAGLTTKPTQEKHHAQ